MYKQTQNMISKNREFNRNIGMHKLQVYSMMHWLGASLIDHRRARRDASIAVSMMSWFFPGSAFLESAEGQGYTDTLLMKQAERAKKLPDRRRHESNSCMPEEHWDE